MCAEEEESFSKTKARRGMFHATHYLIAASGKKTEVCLEQTLAVWVVLGKNRTRLVCWGVDYSVSPRERIAQSGETTFSYSIQPLSVETVTETAPSTASQPLAVRPYTVKEVCQRFKCSDKSLKRMRTTPDFAQWSQSRDPEGMVWEWKEGKYFPVMKNEE